MRSVGEWAAVTEQMRTRPETLQLVDRLVFEQYSGDDLVWTPGDDAQYLLVRIDRGVTDAPEGESVRRPDPFEYAVRIGDRSYQPRAPLDRTNVIIEPIEGGYETGAGGGTAHTYSSGHLAFEVPDDVTEADIRIRYDDGVDGEPVVWVPDAPDEENES